MAPWEASRGPQAGRSGSDDKQEEEDKKENVYFLFGLIVYVWALDFLCVRVCCAYVCFEVLCSEIRKGTFMPAYVAILKDIIMLGKLLRYTQDIYVCIPTERVCLQKISRTP